MRRFFFLLFLSSILFSCNESGIGIFYSISQEQPLEDTTLPNNLSVSGMVKGTTNYLLSAGGLYSRVISEGATASWDDEVKLPSNASVDYTLCMRLVAFNGKMYGLFTDITGSNTALFSTPNDKIDWSKEGTFENRLVALAASETALFVSERVDPATLVTKTSADSFASSLTLTGQYTGVIDAVEVGFNSNTYLISGTDLYSGTGTTFAPVTGTDAPTTTSGFGGLYYSADLGTAGILFVSTKDGAIFSTDDGISWDTTTKTDALGEPVALYDIEGIEILGTQVIVVGAKNGYYDIVFEGGYSSSFSLEVPGSEEAGEFSSSDANFLSIDLKGSVIRFFYFDEAANTLFACTSGNGLWINPVSGSTSATLIRKWDRQ
jgi:hypothetical protein